MIKYDAEKTKKKGVVEALPLMHGDPFKYGFYYGGDGSGSAWDKTMLALFYANQFNPISNLWDAITGYVYGTDRFGNPMSQFDQSMALVGILPFGSIENGIAKTTAMGLWVLTKEGASIIKTHKVFGTFYKSNSDGLWWVVDRAGHGGSKFKVFTETSNGLQWYRDADQYGNFIINKHKGSTGMFIP